MYIPNPELLEQSVGTNLTLLDLTESVPFSTAIKFNKLGTFYDQHTVGSAVTFTIDSQGQAAGGSATVRLQANGTDLPVLGAFKRWSGTGQYDNRSGVVNIIRFWYDGLNYYYAVGQEIGAEPEPIADTTPPAFQTTTFDGSNFSRIVVAYNERLNASSTPAASAFSVTGISVTSVSLSNNLVELNLNQAVSEDSTVTVSYTPPGSNAIEDSSGNRAVAFSSSITRVAQSVNAPILQSVARDPADGRRLLLTYNETLDSSSVPAASAFSLTGMTVSGVVISPSSASVMVTLSEFFPFGSTKTFTYSPPGTNPIQNPTGTDASSFSQSISRGQTESLSWRDLEKVTTSADGTIAETGGSGGNSLPKGATGVPVIGPGEYVQWKSVTQANSTNFLVGLTTTDDQEYGNITTQTTNIAATSASGIMRRFPPFGGSGTNITSVSVADGSVYRLTRSGNNVLIQHSSDGGSNFSTVYTANSVLASANNVYVKAMLGFSSGVKTLAEFTHGKA